MKLSHDKLKKSSSFVKNAVYRDFRTIFASNFVICITLHLQGSAFDGLKVYKT